MPLKFAKAWSLSFAREERCCRRIHFRNLAASSIIDVDLNRYRRRFNRAATSRQIGCQRRRKRRPALPLFRCCFVTSASAHASTGIGGRRRQLFQRPEPKRAPKPTHQRFPPGGAPICTADPEDDGRRVIHNRLNIQPGRGQFVAIQCWRGQQHACH